MKKTITVLWFSISVLTISRAQLWDTTNDWPIAGGNLYIKVGSWISATRISVLDGQTQNAAKLTVNQTSHPASTVVKPKPRPRLGGGMKAESTEASSKTHEDRMNEVTGFLANVVGVFSEKWNAPLEAGEATQWVHEIEAECVFLVEKKNGMIAIESITNSPDTTEMAELRQSIGQYNESDAIYGKRFTTPLGEMARLKDFLGSLAPLKLPECLESMPGNPLRIRLSVKIVRLSHTGGLLPPPAPIAETEEVSTGSTKAMWSGVSSTYTPPAGFTRPISHDELLKHTDVADPVYQYVIGFRYLEGDGLQKNFAMALQWFTKAGEQGYAPAQTQLGFMYDLGYGAPRDPSRALHWYRKAADQNYVRAIFNLGTMYQNGLTIPRDLAEAARWSRKGAELGDPDCQVDLARRYVTGEGVTKDAEEAFGWFMKAALQGNTFAQFTVGTMYELGQGTAKDEIEALAWYNFAPTNGLSEKINNRERMERTLGPEAATAARRRAQNLREKIVQK